MNNQEDILSPQKQILITENDARVNTSGIYKGVSTQPDQAFNFDDHNQGIEDANLSRVYFQRYFGCQLYFIFRLLKFEQCCAFFNLIALGQSVFVYDMVFEERDPDILNLLLWSMFFGNCILALITFWRYKSLLDFHHIRGSISKQENLVTTGFLFYWILECCIVALFPTVWYNDIKIFFYNEMVMAEAYYHLNELMCLLMSLRVIIIARWILVQTRWFANRAQRVCNLYACDANYMFVAKSLMRTTPYTAIFSTMICLILVFGYAVRICESPLNRIDISTQYYRSYMNSFWNIIVTMTTLGYGDYYPRTAIGRLVIFSVCIFGVFVVSMMVVTLTNSLQTTSLESKAITVLQRLMLRRQMIDQAGCVITLMAKIGLGQKKKTLTTQQIGHYLGKMKEAQMAFKIIQRNYKSLQDSGSLKEDIYREFHNVSETFKEIDQVQQRLLKNTNYIYKQIKQT